MKRISIFILVLIFLLALSASAAEVPTVYDTGSFFSEDEIEAIDNACNQAKQETNVHFMVVTTADSLWGVEVLDIFGLSDNDDLVLLVITKDAGVYYDLYTYGKAVWEISSYEVGLILDDPAVYDNLKGGNLKEGSLAFLKICADTILTANEPDVFTPNMILPMIGLGMLASFIVCLIVFFSYKRKKRSESYPLNAYTNLELTERQDIFTGSFVTKRRIDTSSGSSRSGGGSRGGGGGHRGGR